MGIINEGVQGQSKKNFVMSVDNDESAKNEKIEDKYSAPSKSIPATDDDDERRDETTVKRESFLSVYKENNDADAVEGNDEPDLSNGIRFKRDAEEDEPNFDLKTGPESSDGKRPLI